MTDLYNDSPEKEFINALKKLPPAESRILRQASGRPLGASVPVYDTFNEVWRPLRRKYRMVRWAYYLVATLYPWHPSDAFRGSLARSLKRLKQKDNEEKINNIFARIVSANRKQLELELVHAVRLLARMKIPIDWVRLLHDLSRWHNPGIEKTVQTEWIDDFVG